ncbi:MAG: TldD/PmbA family protein [Ichthyobacteriaceae bacterium]|nr:TldD/PmbA family protein [Ichthyobacteriaceae bacterium]
MTKEEKYILARWAVDYAIKSGAQQAKVSIAVSNNSSVEVRDEKIDKLEQSTQSGLSISLFVDKKYSSHSTNRLNNKEELKHFIDEAIIGTRFLAEDEFRSLPNEDLYFKGELKDLAKFDDKYTTITPEQKIDIAFALEKEVLGKDDRIISVTASYHDGMSSSVMVCSNGFEGYREGTYFGVSASVSVNGGESRPESGWGDSSLFFKDLKTKGIAEVALKRGLDKIGQQKIASAEMPMLVENRLVGSILSPMISAISGASIQQQNSFLIDKIGEVIGSDLLTIVDDPFIISGRGSRMFDGEGLATKKRTIIDKGVLKTYFIDTYYGKKLNMEPTSGGSSNLILQPGDKNFNQLILSIEKGIYVTGFNGGNTNATTGDFSYGIEGFLVENGKIIKPVSEMNITGNIVELFNNLTDVGNDVYENSAWRMPSLLFNKVDFSGL